MRRPRTPKRKIGDIGPSQLMYAYGVGSIVELPNLSVMVMGLDDWPRQHSIEIGEPRLLEAIQQELGPQVERMLTPPVTPESTGFAPDPLDASANVGVPVAPFPRWMVCPVCRLLAPIGSDLFELKTDAFRGDRNRYVHRNCSKSRKPPTVVPARFLVACDAGHLDDFPWVRFVHRGETDCAYQLQLYELGASGEVADIQVECVRCKSPRKRRMAEAFTEEGKAELSTCTARWPHLRTFDDEGCDRDARPILLGASNSWFPLQRSALFIPAASDRLGRLVEEQWAVLEEAESLQNVALLRRIGQLRPFADYSDEDVWGAIQARAAGGDGADGKGINLREPEWSVFAHPDPSLNGRDFRVRTEQPPSGYGQLFEKVVLVERLREVNALIGFSRIGYPGDLGDADEFPEEQRAPLSRGLPPWVPATEVRGEGLFIQFSEGAIEEWMATVVALDGEFFAAHRGWRRLRNLEPDLRYPGLRFVLLHSFAHALMRQLSLECGYTTASIRERIYSQAGEDDQEPMAGVLLYTAASDSEGTLGGLVSLGQPETLGYHIDQTLESIRLCASDPLCAEHRAGGAGLTVHAAACHACLFAPETSCERGNRYLDRSVLVHTVDRTDFAFFERQP